MVQAEKGHEIGREVGGEFGIAIGAVGNEVDQLSETDQALRVGRARSLHEELQEGLVLTELVIEVILVRSGAALDRTASPWVNLATYAGSRRTLYCRLGRSASTFSSAPTLRLTILYDTQLCRRRRTLCMCLCLQTPEHFLTAGR